MCIRDRNNEIFFPNNLQLQPISFASIAIKFLESKGYEAEECDTEEEARAKVGELIKRKKWPVHFTASDTTGEKPCEEFYTSTESLDLERYRSIGIVNNQHHQNDQLLTNFVSEIENIRSKGVWEKDQLVQLFEQIIPDFKHIETGKFLDEKM